MEAGGLGRIVSITDQISTANQGAFQGQLRLIAKAPGSPDVSAVLQIGSNFKQLRICISMLIGPQLDSYT